MLYHKIIHTETELPVVAKEFLEVLGSHKHFAFYAQMGAGKTTFIKELCKQLDVLDATTSPSFSIVNEYLTADDETIYHIDLYRLKHAEEALDIGMEEILYSDAYVFMEWPQIIESMLPDTFRKVEIRMGDGDKREIKVS